MVKSNTPVIIITGPMSSGKGALNFFLINRGFSFIRHTKPIFERGLKENLDMNERKNWLDIVVRMRKKDGLEILSKLSSERINEGDRHVISPIRHPADIKFFKKKYDALVIYVDADSDKRYKRTFLKEITKGLTKEEFTQKDKTEFNPKGKNKKYLPNMTKCKELADETVYNDGSLNELNAKLERILRKHKLPDIVDNSHMDDVEM